MGKDDFRINGKFKNKDILSLDQFSLKDVETVLKTAGKMKKIVQTKSGTNLLDKKIMAAIFYEPSSRTFSSFITSMQRLGGGIIPLQGMQNSSVAKGESLEDTAKTFASYSDIMVVRHPEVGSVAKMANAVEIPVINAGDGIGEHPTQALLDMYTIHDTVGSLNNLTGVMAGDMLNGRTVHSLIRALSLYKKITLYLLSPKQLRLSREYLKMFQQKGIKIIEIDNDKDMPNNAHFWYWTRVQKERFSNLEDYEKVKNRFILTPKLIKEKAGKNTIFMHPLPRVGEILTEVDEDKRAVYLTSEMRNGMYVRMALLALVLGKA